MNEQIRKNTLLSCWIIFAILILVHGFEAIVLRMDETFFGENFINKVFGILVVFLVVRSLNWKLSDIGFANTGFIKHIGIGLLIAMCSFVISYGAEIIILKSQGYDIGFGIFTTGFSLTGEADVHTGLGFILMCVFFNNCIATNLLHVITESGVDEMMIVRVAIAQLLSFTIILMVWKKRENR